MSTKGRYRKNRDELALTVKTNIEALCARITHGKKAIAQRCQVSQPLVSKWTAKIPTLPPVEYLYIIADFFGVSLDWLVTDHERTEMPGRIKTYGQAFLAMIPLLENGAVPSESIEDPILQYLMKRYEGLISSSISEDKIAGWMQTIVRDYDIPLPEVVDRELCNEILHTQTNIREVDDDRTYRNLAIALQPQNTIIEDTLPIVDIPDEI